MQASSMPANGCWLPASSTGNPICCVSPATTFHRPTTTTDKDLSEAEHTVAQELNGLSRKEREQIFDDVHGVSAEMLETPELIMRTATRFEDEIKKIPNKKAYNQAKFLAPKYVSDPTLLLMFLRADRFNPYDAARRMVNYFEQKLELFGVDKLVREISAKDLPNDEQEVIFSGSVQCFPSIKDKAGRTMFYDLLHLHNYKRMESQMRLFWYMVTSAVLRDESTQIKGLTVVAFSIGPLATLKANPQLMVKAPRITRALPVKISGGVHFCFDNPAIRGAASLGQMAFAKDGRLRFRPHFGSFLECIYALMSFGITPDILPIDSEGELKQDNFKVLMTHRIGLENQLQAASVLMRQASSVIETPDAKDIILGRGKPFQNHPGNRRLAEIAAKHRSTYESVPYGGKADMCNEVVIDFKRTGGRFLKRRDGPEGGWEEVDDETARKKVSHAFRTKPTRMSSMVPWSKDTQ